MTVETTDNRINYPADGVKTNFAFNFKVFDEADMVVEEDGVVTTATVVVNLNADQDATPGGSVDVTPAILAPIVVAVVRRVSGTQDADYTSGDKFASATHEKALDRLAMYNQELRDELNRCIIADSAEPLSGVSLALPGAAARASKFLAFDTLGNVIAAVGTAGSLAPTSAYIDTLLPAGNSAAARAILESVGASVANVLTGNNEHQGQNTFEYGPNFAIATGGPGAYIATLSPALDAYRDGARYHIDFATPSVADAPTININGLGVKTIKDKNGEALDGKTGSQWTLRGRHIIEYDGTDMRVINAFVQQITPIENGIWTPTIVGGGSGWTYQVQKGTWFKIWNNGDAGYDNYIRGYIALLALGTLSGNVQIGGLPASSDGTELGSFSVGYASGLSITAGQVVSGDMATGSSQIRLNLWDATTGVTNLQGSEVTAGLILKFHGHYFSL